MRKKYGLIGYPLSHSFSKNFFTEKFAQENRKDSIYLNFEIENLSKFPEIILKNPEIVGLNVTIPYKEKILKYVDKQDESVQKIGATNTLKIINNQVIAYNTDIYGFEMSLKNYLSPLHKNALILGTGGASKSVAFVLEKLGIQFKFVSRTPYGSNQISYKDLNKEILETHLLVINTTPVGSYPEINKMVEIPYKFTTKNHIFYDLIYNPAQTKFLKEAKKMGATTVNGLKMLYLQAEKSWEIWNK